MPLPTDPLLTNQWHLINTVPGQVDLNVSAVWNPAMGAAYTGAGVIVAVAGDGFDYSHEDLASNYLTAVDNDFRDQDVDPFGLSTEGRGTMMLGIIGAADNTVGGVGVAYNSSLIGYRTVTEASSGTIATWSNHIGDVVISAVSSAQVLNFSYGLGRHAGAQFNAMASFSQEALFRVSANYAVDNGRGGLGLIIVQGAGSQGNEANSYALTNDTRLITVSTVGNNGFATQNSGHGASLLVAGLGSPTTIISTDRTGAAGFDTGDYTGFSSPVSDEYTAAAMVSGVVALMLEANSSLGWRDVQTILAYSARHVGTEIGDEIIGNENAEWFFNGATNWNGGGLHFGLNYGFGLVDARAAVRLAETWLDGAGTAQTSVNEEILSFDALPSTVVINGSATTSSFDVTNNMTIERVAVTVAFETTFLGDLNVTLIDPDGTRYQVIAAQGSDADFNGSWTFELQSLRGVSTLGTWQVELLDPFADDPITITDVQVAFYGSSQVNDRYIFTNEFSDYGALNQITTTNDTDGGIDEVNAAAVTGNSLIYLDGRTGRIDGLRVKFINVENAFGGDGNDTIVGSSGTNSIFGGRGRDSLSGASGNDLIMGDAGNDFVNGGDGQDTLYGGDGNDTVNGDLGTDPVTLSNDVLDGGAGNDHIYGGVGNDFFHAGTGNDSFYGGTGSNDVVSYEIEIASVNVDLLGTIIGNNGGALGDGFDQIEGLIGTNFGDQLYGNFDANYLVGLAGNDILVGWAGNDSLYGGADNDVLDGGEGADYLDGGSGTRDVASYATSAAGLTASLTGPLTNTGDALGDVYVGIEELVGSNFGDTLRGNNFSNALYGSQGFGGGFNDSDLLDGRGGSDYLYGGEGFDTLIGGTGADSLYGGNNFDSASYETALTGVVASLSVPGGNTGDAAGDEYNSIEALIGSSHGDDLEGDSIGNVILGGNGNDTIAALAGLDQVYGGNGDDLFRELSADSTDYIYGGAGNDVVSYADFDTAVVADLTNNFSDTGDDMIDVEALVGSIFDDSLYGNTGAESLSGYEGDDYLEGRDGADHIDGGNGIRDMASYLSSTAPVLVDLEAPVQSGGHAAGDVLLNIEDIRGSQSHSSVLRGNSGFNILIGGDQNDDLSGRAGDDTLYGGDGNDTLQGGAGADSLDGGFGDRDLVSYVNSTDWVSVDLAGFYSTSYGEAEGDTIIDVEDADGSIFGDIIYGTDVANILRGFDGLDFLSGRDGADTLDGGDDNDLLNGGLGADSLIGGAGTSDQADYFNATASVRADLSNAATNTGEAAGDTYSGIEGLYGSFHSDTLVGNNSANILTGANGNDVLYALGGDDTLYGGNDNDTLRGGLGADQLSGDAGIDTVNYSQSTVGLRVDLSNAASNTGEAVGDLFVSIENLQGSNFNDTLIGDSGGNLITGFLGNDVIYGGVGTDRLQGSEGNDTLRGGVGADMLEGGTGQDVANYSAASAGVWADLAATANNTGEAAGDTYNSIENLQGSNFADTLNGDGLDNQIQGFSGNDLINAGAGADKLNGMLGNDTLNGGSGADEFLFNTALGVNNVDTVQSYSVADDTIALDDVIFTALSAGALAGSAFVTGGAAGNASHRIIYNSATGELFYDSDGTGAAAQTLFAVLSPALALTAADFLVV